MYKCVFLNESMCIFVCVCVQAGEPLKGVWMDGCVDEL